MTGALDIIDRLIGFDTVSHRSNLDLVDFVEGYLRARGFRVHRIADLQEPKAGIYAEIGPARDGGLLLSAHSDVVPAEGQVWSKPPFQLSREGDRLFGRGTTDMKGFLAEMLALADTVKPDALHAPLGLVISYDEEIGCVGIDRMKARLAPLLRQPRLAIVGEPTEMQVAIGHKGKRSYRATISGEAGHSALAPQFANALHLACDLVSALRHLQAQLEKDGVQDPDYAIPYSTVHVGKVSGGTALNIVPEAAELLFEIRHLAEEDPDAIEQRIRAAARAAAEAYGGRCSFSIDQIAAYPGLATPAHAGAVKAALAASGGQITKVAFGTEAGVFAEMGIPTVICGPGSMAGQGHKADEFISLSQLDACSKMLRHAVQTLLVDPT
ncbi:MAG: acetylornithine deacetylase [Pseudomonadota bacterium]